MNDKQVKVVIGANYGDEGKGLATHYFAAQAQKENKKCLNVLYNGGCQRGHTVELKDGTRHVFHHFGSGTFDGADTYFDEEFMVNPIIFVQEYNELKPTTECYISEKCRVTTPFDMMLNQCKEQWRGDKKHGSCGMGIFETRKRYERGEFALTYGDMIYMSKSELQEYLKRMFDEYFMERFDTPRQEMYSASCEFVIDNFIFTLREMMSVVKIDSFERLSENYQSIIFEGGQGLALDEGLINETVHLTPSHTTSKLPVIRAREIDCDYIEICYVTRSYFTRHGAGESPTECSKSEINDEIVDMTNVPNEFQDSIRYGKFDFVEFNYRVMDDFIESQICENCGNFTLVQSAMITHLNYVDIKGLHFKDNLFSHIYKSNSRYAEDIIEERVNYGRENL